MRSAGRMIVDGGDDGIVLTENTCGSRRAGLGVEQLRLRVFERRYRQLPMIDQLLLLRRRERLGNIVQDPGTGSVRLIRAVFFCQQHGGIGHALRVGAALFLVQRKADAAQICKRQRVICAAHAVEPLPFDHGQHVRVQDLVRNAEKQEPTGLGRRNFQTVVLQNDGPDAERGLHFGPLGQKLFGQCAVCAHAGHADGHGQLCNRFRLAPLEKERNMSVPMSRYSSSCG